MRNTLFIALIALVMQGCKVYSFTGANIDPNIKTLSVAYINNKSGNGPATASDILTNMLKEKMLTNTNLKMVNANGDVQFLGDITNYTYSIQAPSGNLSSNLRRISISITVSFVNTLSEDESFESQTFTRFADYPVDEDLNAVEETIIRDVGSQLVDDIFNKAFVKW